MPSTPPTTPITTSYWCYSCTRFVSVWADTTHGVACPLCDGGFIEEANSSSDTVESATPAASTEARSANTIRRSVIRRRRSNRRPSFNPVIVLQGGANEGEEESAAILVAALSSFTTMMDPDRLSQIEIAGFGIGRSGNPPASKSAIESLPRVEISDCHVAAEANCAVCTEVFEEETEAREMPCKHIFHEDCIVPWLSIRNSCPVCRFEIPSESSRRRSNEDEEDNAVGMTIWRLPGGGFAVGRFNAAMRDGERVLPVVLTEMDGGGLGGNGEGPRRISWVRGNGAVESGSGNNGGGSESGGRLRRMVRGVVSLMRRVRPNRGSNSNSDTEVESRVMDRSNSVLRRYFGRNRSNRDSSVLH
ncbi:unnamed protein product [Eruca vesicaria subsp. sativa]|uniref:RING-type E3 ubiquitin transferase n=1 Tax=Eruca vesicaria subsp. sativa TaxID=29727 RepID=A0ABC8IRV2_ERUVS|nr:unnamed protein product [Eruca vesicaria subsp. sativa]